MLSVYGGQVNDPHFVPVAYSKLPSLLSFPPGTNSGLESTQI